MRYKNLLPVATLTALTLTIPTAAHAGSNPSINVSNDPQCAGFTFTPTVNNDAFTGGAYTVTAQEYDSETVSPVGAEALFTGSVAWGETVSLEIPAATDYLLWTHRVDSNAAGEAITTYGERQLDCRPSEAPDPEPEPEEPGDDVPLTPLEPATPVEDDEETPEVSEVETPKTDPTTVKVVTEKTTTSGSPVVETPKPVVVEPRTAG